MSRVFAGRIDAWMTLNEPWCSAYLGYTEGRHAPGLTDARYGVEAMHHLLFGHGLATIAIRANDEAPVGLVCNVNAVTPASDSAATAAAPPERAAASANHWVLDPLLLGRYPAPLAELWPGATAPVRAGDMNAIGVPMDFLGINYYFRQVVESDGAHGFTVRPLPGVERTQMGWEVYPQGLRDLLLEFKQRYPKLPPIYITENGMASDDSVSGGRVRDDQRVRYFNTHLGGRGRGHAPGRRRARLFRLVVARQLRVELRLREALRHRPHQLPDAGTHAQGQRARIQGIPGPARALKPCLPHRPITDRADATGWPSPTRSKKETSMTTISRHVFTRLGLGLALAFGALGALPGLAHAQANRAEVIHWWTSGGESAAVKELANAYKAAGGTWVDAAIAGGEQARSTAINRMVGGTPPTAAQFNTSQQFRDLIDSGMLNDVDAVAAREGWDKILPAPILNSIKIKGHFYAVPVDIHMPAWFWYSKAAFAKAGIAAEPKTPDALFADLDKLKAAGLVPLAHGGQPWQEKIVFDAWLAHAGGPEMYLKLYRDKDTAMVQGAPFKAFLASFKRLKNYVDAGSPNRNWNDATAMLISGKAGVQIMGDWAKGECIAANETAGKDFGCFPGFGPKSPYLIAGDVFVFPKTADPADQVVQQLLATVFTAPATQVAFSNKEGLDPDPHGRRHQGA